MTAIDMSRTQAAGLERLAAEQQARTEPSLRREQQARTEPSLRREQQARTEPSLRRKEAPDAPGAELDNNKAEQRQRRDNLETRIGRIEEWIERQGNPRREIDALYAILPRR